MYMIRWRTYTEYGQDGDNKFEDGKKGPSEDVSGITTNHLLSIGVDSLYWENKLLLLHTFNGDWYVLTRRRPIIASQLYVGCVPISLHTCLYRLSRVLSLCSFPTPLFGFLILWQSPTAIVDA